MDECRDIIMCDALYNNGILLFIVFIYKGEVKVIHVILYY